MKYRVFFSRWDIPEEKIEEFEEDSDEKARERFDKEFKKNKSFDWDYLKLVRFTEVIIEMSDPKDRQKAH